MAAKRATKKRRPAKSAKNLKVRSSRKRNKPPSTRTLDLIKFEFLKQLDLFQGFSEAMIHQMVSAFKEVVVTKDQFLFHEGDPEKEMYLVLCGQLLITRMNKRIAVLGPGEYLGEMALIESKPRSASAIALTDMVLLKIVENQFKKFLVTDSASVLAMVKTLSKRLRHDVESMAFEMRRLNNFTHDMRNCVVPLGLVEAHLDEAIRLLRGTAEWHKPRRGCDQVDRGFRTLLSVRNNLLTLMEQSLACSRRLKQDYIKTPGCLQEVIAETVEEMSYHKYLKNKEIVLHPGQPIGDLSFNFLDIKRVVQNLLINAGYVTMEGGLIELEVTADSNFAQVDVTDHGPGILEQVRPRLFREDITTKADGNGFGLLSCKEIVEDYHNGRIWFKTLRGKGTTFFFTLPRHTDERPLEMSALEGEA